MAASSHSGRNLPNDQFVIFPSCTVTCASSGASNATLTFSEAVVFNGLPPVVSTDASCHAVSWSRADSTHAVVTMNGAISGKTLTLVNGCQQIRSHRGGGCSGFSQLV